MITRLTPNYLNTAKSYENKKYASKDVCFEANRVAPKKLVCWSDY